MANLDTYLSPLDDASPRMTERTTLWSAINSGTNNVAGVEEVAAAIIPEFTKLGMNHKILPPAPVEALNDEGKIEPVPCGPVHHLSLRPEAEKRIMLVGHLDTVFPADHPFQKVEKRKDGTLHGPGCADMKGGLCVILESLGAFEKSPFAKDVGIDVVFNSDEETGSYASAAHLEAIARKADAGFVFEPALPDGTLAGARAGSGHYNFVVRGKSAHAGRSFHDGRNALIGAARLMTAINALNGKRDNTTLNIGIINGGQATNVVPDLCVIRMNIRGLTKDDLLWADAAIRDVVASGNFGPDISVELHGGIHRPVKQMTGGTEQLFNLVKNAGSSLGMAIEWKATGGCCDGNNLAAAGLPNVDTMGVRGAFIHSPDEYMVIESFVERARLATMSMLLLASGELPWPDRMPV